MFGITVLQKLTQVTLSDERSLTHPMNIVFWGGKEED